MTHSRSNPARSGDLVHLLVVTIIIILMSSCSTVPWAPYVPPILPDTLPAPQGSGLRDVRSWAVSYQVNMRTFPIQELRVCDGNTRGPDMLVLDYEAHSRPYSSREIDRYRKELKTKVISYMSVGAAEDYRWYFRTSWISSRDGALTSRAPSYLLAPDDSWPGEYTIRYWDPAWERVLFSYLDRILRTRFDGVFLDLVDVYRFWSSDQVPEESRLTREDAAERMIRLIKRIAAYTRLRDPDFIIIPQNAEHLLRYDTDGSYLATLDAVNAESLYYRYSVPRSEEYIALRNEDLSLALAAGKPVFVIDYVYTPESPAVVRDYMERAWADGYIPYAGIEHKETGSFSPIICPPHE